MFLTIKDLALFFGEKQILDIDEIAIQEGELVTLLGPSGCGKSTLLRCITGLEKPKRGEIILDGQAISDQPTKDREIGFVFQNYALFPTMTVFENVAFGLQVQKMPKSQVQEKVLKILDLVDMTEQAEKNVQQLSGGQKQRVALARSLVTEPKVLLLDEPLSALDARIRKQLQRDLRHIQQKLGMTMIFVTHDQEEAMRISDRIFILDKGSVAQVSTASQLYQTPKTNFVAEFIGNYNKFTWVELSKYTDYFSRFANQCLYYIRPELIQTTVFSDAIEIPVTLKEQFVLGNITRSVCLADGVELLIDQLNNQKMESIGSKVYVKPEDILAIAVEEIDYEKA